MFAYHHWNGVSERGSWRTPTKTFLAIKIVILHMLGWFAKSYVLVVPRIALHSKAGATLVRKRLNQLIEPFMGLGLAFLWRLL